MKVSIDYTELTREVQRSEKLKPVMRERMKKRLRVVSLELMGEIKKRMPVDTGRARASWGAFTPEFLRQLGPEVDPSDAVWIVGQDGFEITQGTRVPYVANLNEGSSMQAPAGFIDAEATKAADKLAKGIAEDVEGVILDDNSPELRI
jgi:hypothetical protein